MKNIYLIVISALAFIATPAAAVDCNQGALPAAWTQAIDVSNPNFQTFSNAVRYYSNWERCRYGLPPLKGDRSLLLATMTHSANMARANNMSHTLNVRGQATLRDRMRSANVSMRRASENIAQNYVYVLGGRERRLATNGQCGFTYTNGQKIPRHSYASLAYELVNLWMASPGHRQNLLDRKVNRMEAAYGYTPEQSSCGFIYVAQNFAG